MVDVSCVSSSLSRGGQKDWVEESGKWKDEWSPARGSTALSYLSDSLLG